MPSLLCASLICYYSTLRRTLHSTHLKLTEEPVLLPLIGLKLILVTDTMMMAIILDIKEEGERTKQLHLMRKTKRRWSGWAALLQSYSHLCFKSAVYKGRIRREWGRGRGCHHVQGTWILSEREREGHRLGLGRRGKGKNKAWLGLLCVWMD